MRVTRLFKVLDRLRGLRRPRTAEALAEDLGVSVRTVYRDIATLQSIGAPIEGQAGIGYMLRRGFFLPPLSFDPDELESLILGTRIVAARGDPELAAAARRASAKIAHVLGSTGRSTRLPLHAAPLSRATNADETRALRLVRHAIRSREILHVVYRDSKERTTERHLRPVGLTAFDVVWLVTAWCESREDFRSFRLDRFVSLRATGQRFRDEPGKLFEDFLARMNTTL
ncbi:MAG: DNA-binding transcriptional regulator [Myxococcales bacterium 68-20]|nr:MAG: DNA-binding transcriptional regulator [Myxococcales bacterium 68-20]